LLVGAYVLSACGGVAAADFFKRLSCHLP
jgi:hypothetical protein